MQTKRLYRSQTERMIAGVCAGLGDYLNLDVSIIRLVFILLFLFSGGGLLVYVLMWIIVPREPVDSGISTTVPPAA